VLSTNLATEQALLFYDTIASYCAIMTATFVPAQL